MTKKSTGFRKTGTSKTVRSQAAGAETQAAMPSPTAVETEIPAGAPPSHAEIADRAKAIWQAKGCPKGQDEPIWFEAVAQLRNERSSG